jgi:hypothetical protein
MHKRSKRDMTRMKCEREATEVRAWDVPQASEDRYGITRWV